MSELLKYAQQAENDIRLYESVARKAMTVPSVADIVAGANPSTFGGNPQRAKASEAYQHHRSWIYVSIEGIVRRAVGQDIYAAAITGASPNPERRWMGHKSTRVRERTPAFVRDKAHATGELEMLADHPVLDALYRPNPVQGKAEFLRMLAYGLLLPGEAYIIGGVVKDKDGERWEMWAVPTNWVEPVHDGGMFTGYNVRIRPNEEPEFFPPENVARMYFPHPADLKSAWSPLMACFPAVEIDRHILSSQRQTFERGIFPNVVLTVGQAHDAQGKPTGRRPVLEGHQRRALIRAVRQVWYQSVGGGDPAIIDGLIERVHKLSNTPAEMDWTQSGKTVKERIFQTYGVNPIAVGQDQASNRAQAVEAERSICNGAVNPLLSMISEALTDFLGPVWDDPPRLLVWIDPCVPNDPDLEIKRWSEGMKNGAADAEEYRAEILGLPPREQSRLASVMGTPGGLNAFNNLLTARTNGAISVDGLVQLLMEAYGFSEESARTIATSAPPPDSPPDSQRGKFDEIDFKPPKGVQQAYENGLQRHEDGETGDGIEESTIRQARRFARGEPTSPEWARKGNRWWGRNARFADAEPGTAAYAAAQLWGGRNWFKRIVEAMDAAEGESHTEPAVKQTSLGRDLYKQFHAKQYSEAEEAMGDQLARFFRGTVREFSEALKEHQWTPNAERAQQQAAELAGELFDLERFDEQLVETAAPLMSQAIAEGARTEAAMLGISAGDKRIKSTASEIAARLEIEVPPGLGTEPPQWLIDAAQATLGETFRQEYWLKINKTTRDDIQRTLASAISEGWSVERVVREIVARHGAEYSRFRARNVARTECLVGDTAVDGANITAAYKREFTGDLFEVVTDTGRTLTGTPNHPMLTLRGWVPLSQLTKEDYLIGYTSAVKESGAAGNKNVQAPPATISQIFDSLGAVAVPGRERTGQPDFHGDGMDGYVDVFRTDGPLLHGTFAPITEGLCEGVLEGSDIRRLVLAASSNTFSRTVPVGVESRLSRCSDGAAGSCDTPANVANCNPVFVCQRCGGFPRLISLADNVVRKVFGKCTISGGQHVSPSLREVAYNAFSLQNASNRILANVKHLGHLPHAKPRDVQRHDFNFCGLRKSLVIPWRNAVLVGNASSLTRASDSAPSLAKPVSNCRIGNTETSRNSIGTVPGRIQLHRVANLRITKNATNHVYNLSTEDGYFIANGLYTGNTAGMLNSGHEAAIQETERQTGIPMGKELLSVLGSTTRDTHADADGQVVASDGMFDIGGFEAPYPGHYSLPPQERCGCQCTVISAVIFEGE